MPQEKWVLLQAGSKPTEDIYFLESTAPTFSYSGKKVICINTNTPTDKLLPIKLSQPNIMESINNANLIICRKITPKWITFLERHQKLFKKIFYLIDDDIPAAAIDKRLSQAYRYKMHKVALIQPRLISLSDEIVACSETLAHKLKQIHSNVSILTPALISPLPSLDHYKHSSWHVGYHGSGVHSADIKYIMPSLLKLHDTHVKINFEIMLGRHTPAELTSLKRLTSPQPKNWNKFKQYQRKRRIHIGLAPLMDTPFNQCKSFIKFLDITAMGGVGIYSNRLPYSDIISHGVDGLLANDCQDEWYKCLVRLIENPMETLGMAKNAAEKAIEVGNPSITQHFWQSRG